MKDKDLIQAAKEAAEAAYAPYSGFKVGAAILAEDGRVFTGCNVENASYGLTICAERTAAAKAVSEKAARFLKMAVYTGGKEICTPCGACRQFLSEFGLGMEILMVNGEGQEIIKTLEELLPFCFNRDSFQKDGR